MHTHKHIPTHSHKHTQPRAWFIVEIITFPFCTHGKHMCDPEHLPPSFFCPIHPCVFLSFQINYPSLPTSITFSTACHQSGLVCSVTFQSDPTGPPQKSPIHQPDERIKHRVSIPPLNWFILIGESLLLLWWWHFKLGCGDPCCPVLYSSSVSRMGPPAHTYTHARTHKHCAIKKRRHLKSSL